MEGIFCLILIQTLSTNTPEVGNVLAVISLGRDLLIRRISTVPVKIKTFEMERELRLDELRKCV